MEKEYKVPRLLWESFEAILLAQGKRYVKEMATTLKVNEKELLKRVFPTKDALKITIHDTSTTSLQCAAYIQGKSIHTMCRKPVDLGSEFCTAHRVSRLTVESCETVEKLADDASRPSLWIKKDSTVLDIHGNGRGLYNRNTNRLILFQIT